jgi:ankyrin repeat protein
MGRPRCIWRPQGPTLSSHSLWSSTTPMQQHMDKHGQTPLHEASSVGHIELIQFLIHHGADITVQFEDGC